MAEYKISCKVEGQFGKTSTVRREGAQPIGVEKIKLNEPFFLAEGASEQDILKKILKNVAAIFLHQKHGATGEFAAAYQAALEKFQLK